MKKLILCLWVCLTILPSEIYATNFTRGTETAQKFGVHEITLTGDGSVVNPFDTPCEVTFTSSSGLSITVNAFYDGSNTWHARCYITEIGNWSWESVSSRDSGLDNKNGSFSAVNSDLKGLLKKHPADNKALASDDGKWFLNIGDTSYYIFNNAHNKWQEFIRDSWTKGITLIRAAMVGALTEWDRLFDGGDYDKLNINNFQTNDTRLIWMLDSLPDMYVEFILLPACNTGWTGDETLWYNLSGEQHIRIMKYMVARYAAFPEIIWEVVNDYEYSSSHPHNVEMAIEVGEYLMNNDPWEHLITTGGIRGDDFYFTDAKWATLFHLETLDALPADQVKDYTNYPVHVFNGEDRYETYREPDHPNIYFRRLIWAWTLSSGSACYGGYWDDTVPYSQSSFEGLDNIVHVKNFFHDNNIELSGYIPDDNCVSSPARGSSRPKVMHSEKKSSYVIYHPNASIDGQAANISSRTASLTITDLPAGAYTLLWMRADNGVEQKTYFNHDGGARLLSSPWPGIDVVLYLQTDPAVGVKRSPSLSSMNDNDMLRVQPNPFKTSTTIWVRLPENMQVCIDIMNMQGSHVERVAHGNFHSGVHQFIWNANNLPGGIYFIKLQTGSRVYGRMVRLSPG